MREEDRTRAIALQDAIGALVDASLLDGLSPSIVREVLNDEASQIEQRLAAVGMSAPPLSQDQERLVA